MSNTEIELYNAVEAADYLGVNRQRVYDLAKQGRIGRQVAGFWVFTKPELDRYKTERVNRPKGGRPKKKYRKIGAKENGNIKNSPMMVAA